MRANPEQALISKEGRERARVQRASNERRELDAALAAYAARYGAGDAAQYCCVKATLYTLIANPKTPRDLANARAQAEALFEGRAA